MLATNNAAVFELDPSLGHDRIEERPRIDGDLLAGMKPESQVGHAELLVDAVPVEAALGLAQGQVDLIAEPHEARQPAGRDVYTESGLVELVGVLGPERLH
jgi:hypothetical protein